jgi:hypothetical protein
VEIDNVDKLCAHARGVAPRVCVQRFRAGGLHAQNAPALACCTRRCRLATRGRAARRRWRAAARSPGSPVRAGGSSWAIAHPMRNPCIRGCPLNAPCRPSPLRSRPFFDKRMAQEVSGDSLGEVRLTPRPRALAQRHAGRSRAGGDAPLLAGAGCRAAPQHAGGAHAKAACRWCRAARAAAPPAGVVAPIHGRTPI